MTTFLAMNEVLSMNNSLISDNGVFVATMQSDGSFVNRLSNANQYLYWNSGVAPGSAAGPYFAIMQVDGNFVVYKGTGPNNQGGVVWATNVYPGVAAGPYFAVIQNDGNFVIYYGTGPNNQGAPIWATNIPITTLFVNVSNMVYELNQATIDLPQVVGSFIRDLTNDTAVSQQETFTFDLEYNETQKWTTTNSTKVDVQAQFNVSIPIIEDTQSTITAEQAFSSTTDTEQSTTKKYTDAIPVTIPPNSHVTCTATASTTNISLPYTADAVYTLMFSTIFPYLPISAPGNLKGVYVGSPTYELQATWK